MGVVRRHFLRSLLQPSPCPPAGEGRSGCRLTPFSPQPPSTLSLPASGRGEKWVPFDAIFSAAAFKSPLSRQRERGRGRGKCAARAGKSAAYPRSSKRTRERLCAFEAFQPFFELRELLFGLAALFAKCRHRIGACDAGVFFGEVLGKIFPEPSQ